MSVRQSNRTFRTSSFFAAVAILSTITLVGCSKPVAEVEDGKQVSLIYQAKTPEGEVVDANPDSGPIVFVVGRGKLQPEVEKKLYGMKLGEERTFAVPNAYGPYSEEKTGNLPVSALPDDAKVGDEVQMIDGLPSRIKEIRSDVVILDLNHPLAGKEIIFTVQVTDISDPGKKS
jgi:peptidylprolyl isomerase